MEQPHAGGQDNDRTSTMCPYAVGNKVRTCVLATQGGPLKVSRAAKIMLTEKEEFFKKKHGQHLLTLWSSVRTDPLSWVFSVLYPQRWDNIPRPGHQA